MIEPITTLPGTVYSLGQDAEGAAALYARLTGRPHSVCRSVEDVQAALNDVLVCDNSEVTANLMHALYTRSVDGVPGLISASGARMLEDVCRIQASKFAGAQTHQPKRIFLQSTQDFTSYEKDGDLYIGGMLPREALLTALSMDPQILSVTAHSDGIDLDLSLRNFLCPLVDPVNSNADPLMPTCQILGRCTRLPSQPSIADAKRAGWIVPFRSLRAGICVICACRVVRVRDDYVGSSYNLGPSLLASGGIGAIVTSWRGEVANLDGAHLNELINDLSSGEMIGVAVATFNRSTTAMHYGSVKLCVVGDPCFAIFPGATYARLLLPEAPQAAFWEERSPASNPTAEAALLRYATSRAANTNPRFDLAKAKGLMATLKSIRDVSEPASNPLDLESTDRALLDFMNQVPFLETYLYPFGQMDQVCEEATCPMCFGAAKSFRLTFPTQGAKPRHCVRCPCCSDCSVTPSGWRLEVDLSQIGEGRFSISGLPAGTQLRAYIVNVTGSVDRVVNLNPEEPWFCLPQLPVLPLYCQILLVCGLELGSLGFKFRPLPDGRYRTPYNAHRTTRTAV